MAEKEPLMFSFEIVALEKISGYYDFKVQFFNTGIQNEVIITKMRAWLKGAENDYFEQFKKDLT